MRCHLFLITKWSKTLVTASKTAHSRWSTQNQCISLFSFQIKTWMLLVLIWKIDSNSIPIVLSPHTTFNWVQSSEAARVEPVICDAWMQLWQYVGNVLQGWRHYFLNLWSELMLLRWHGGTVHYSHGFWPLKQWGQAYEAVERDEQCLIIA